MLRVRLAPVGSIAPARYSEQEWARLRATRARVGWPSRERGRQGEGNSHA
jgi:hypothetical protein